MNNNQPFEARPYTKKELLDLFTEANILHSEVPKTNLFLQFISINASTIFSFILDTTLQTDSRFRVKSFITTSPTEVIEKFVKNVKVADLTQQALLSLDTLTADAEITESFFEVFGSFLKYNHVIFISALTE